MWQGGTATPSTAGGEPLPKILDLFILWIALELAKGSIPIVGLLQQQNSKDNPLCKCVSKRENT